MSYTDLAENRILDWTSGNTTTAPVLPLKVRMLTVAGTDSTAGTEVTGDTYAPPTVTFDAAAAGSTANDTLLSVVIDTAAQRTIVAVEIWDSAGSPFRWQHGVLDEDKVVNAGDPFEIPIGDLVRTLT